MLKQPHENGDEAALKPVPSLLVDVPGLAEMLMVSERTAKRLLARRTWPVIRIGRRVLVRRSDLEAWVQRGCRVRRA
jgi:excisionase family DNA binding protein